MEAVSSQDMEALYRAAVGPKRAEFYVPKFVRFDQPGASRLSWNWPAFFVSFYWFLYRRMYATWAIYSLLIPICIGVVGGIARGGAGVWFYLVVALGYRLILIPLLANSFYHRATKKRLETLRKKVPETSGQLLVLDNTSPTSPIVWVIFPLVGVAVLGILAAIAIPAYQNYTIRAQVSEAFLLVDPLESAVDQHYQSNKSWPANTEELGLSQSMSGRYVATLRVDHGTVSVTFGNEANSMIARHRLSFRPLLTDTGAIMWTCGYVERSENPRSAIGPNLTDVKPQFLPGACR